MRLREGERVSSLAPVVGSDDDTDLENGAEAAPPVGTEAADGDLPAELDAT
jgi:hypothetical protein